MDALKVVSICLSFLKIDERDWHLPSSDKLLLLHHFYKFSLFHPFFVAFQLEEFHQS